MMQAAAEKADSSSSSSAGSRSKKQPTGWDQLMKPLMQQQRAQAQAATQPQAQQQTYQQYSYQHTQQVQMGSASAGSGWSGENMECDCGEDTCPRCNLLLAMGDGYWSCPPPSPFQGVFQKIVRNDINSMLINISIASVVDYQFCVCKIRLLWIKVTIFKDNFKLFWNGGMTIIGPFFTK